MDKMHIEKYGEIVDAVVFSDCCETEWSCVHPVEFTYKKRRMQLKKPIGAWYIYKYLYKYLTPEQKRHFQRYSIMWLPALW